MKTLASVAVPIWVAQPFPFDDFGLTGRLSGHRRRRQGGLGTTIAAPRHSAPADASMIHFAGPDGVGHEFGYMSDQYVAEVGRTDGFIGALLDTIAADPQLAAHTVVIVTTDHGGLGTSRATASLAVNYTIPFFAWGVGVSTGANLYALNPERAEPGTGRPDYSAPLAPVRNAEAGDLAGDLAADLLGLGPIPGSPINSDQSLDLAA